jgi:hypothetical protein
MSSCTLKVETRTIVNSDLARGLTVDSYCPVESLSMELHANLATQVHREFLIYLMISEIMSIHEKTVSHTTSG